MNNDWDSNNYTDNFQFVHKYGESLIDLLTVQKKSFVVDLGCGNGALTKKLAERGYRVLGIDSSEQMLEKAKELHPELDFKLGDACKCRLDEKADAIFSNAVFHWIDDHKLLVKNLSQNLKSGGELVFEFGGEGNVSTIQSALCAAFREQGLKYSWNSNVGSIGNFASLLEKNGFTVRFASLFDRPTEQNGEKGLENWINNTFKSVDAGTKAKILARTEEICRPLLYRDGKWYIDYVRLRMKAIKK